MANENGVNFSRIVAVTRSSVRHLNYPHIMYMVRYAPTLSDLFAISFTSFPPYCLSERLVGFLQPAIFTGNVASKNAMSTV